MGRENIVCIPNIEKFKERIRDTGYIISEKLNQYLDDNSNCFYFHNIFNDYEEFCEFNNIVEELGYILISNDFGTDGLEYLNIGSKEMREKIVKIISRDVSNENKE